MRRIVLLTLLYLATVGRASGQRASDCLGTRPVQVTRTAIGALNLSLTANSIRRLCAPVRDSAVYTDEATDTAFVLPARDVVVVGRVANIDDSGERKPFRYTPNTRADMWEVSGPGAVLPGGVPLTATWADLRRAYGALLVFPLNGALIVLPCAHPHFRIEMEDPTYAAGKWPDTAARDSVLAKVPIRVVKFPRQGAFDLSDADLRRGCP